MARRATPLTVALLLLAAGLAPSAAASEPGTLRLTGRLLVAAAEAGPEQYAIAVGDDLVPVSWSGGMPAQPGDRVTAEVQLPASLDAAVAEGRTLRADTAAGQQVLAQVDARTTTLTVRTLSVRGESAPAAPRSVTHRVYVAAPSNLGSFALSDAEMLTRVERAAAFWEDEGDGAITDMVVPAQVVRYQPAVATDANNCGLDFDFFDVMEEASAQFPAADFYDGTDLLLLLAPSSCTSTSTAGRALLGQDLASGGVQVSSVNDDFAVGTLGHEWGHNFGLTHSNLGPCVEFDCIGEYDNLYNVMGRGVSPTENRLTALSTAYRSILDVLAPGEVATVPFPQSGPATTSTFSLAPRSEEAGQRAVRVVDPDTGDHVFVEHRSGGGQDAGSAYARSTSHAGTVFRPGVVLESVDDSSAWLRLGPESRTAMVGGQSWSNGSGTLTVSVGAMTASSASVTVVATPGAAWSSDATVAIEGDPSVGSTLFLTESAWDENQSARHVQWYVDNVAVAGATDWSYAVRPADVDRQVRVAITDYGYGLRPRTTTSTPVLIRPGTLSFYDRPTVSGVAEVGRTLRTSGAIWDSPQFSGPTSTSLQWSSGGVAVPGATGSSYVVRAEDVGKRIRVAETGTRTGYEARTLESDPTAVVPAPPFPSPPTPTVTGEARVAQPLALDAGPWPSGTDLDVRWLADGRPISGATATTYTPAASDVGRRISVKVTASHPSYRTTTRTSAMTAPVLRGVLGAGTPTVTGTARVGRTLVAAPGTWTPTPRLGYQWLADGRAIRGATGRRLVLRSAHRGARISVKVTGSLEGYAKRSVTSAATRPVRR